MKVVGSDRSRALEIAIEACSDAGFEAADARVIRVQSSIHVEFPRDEVLARVEAPGRTGIAQRQVLAARTWGMVGAPVASLIRPEIQPFVFGKQAVTLWRRLRNVGEIDLFELGQTTRCLHSTTRGRLGGGLPVIDVLADVRPWMEGSGFWLRPSDRVRLANRMEVLGSWWGKNSSKDPAGTVLAHGDLHGENALKTEQGIVMVDLEHAGVGPAGWDFVPLAVGVRRYGESVDRFERFVDGYGTDPRVWTGFESMCQIYELMVTIWAFHCSDTTPEMIPEARIRVDGILGRSKTRWTMR